MKKNFYYTTLFFPLFLAAAAVICFFSPETLWAQLKTEFSNKGGPLSSPENLPRVKTADPYTAHTRHSFYFQDTLASVILKFTMSPGFSPRDPSSLNDLGYIYYFFGEYRDAEAQFQKAIEINPTFVDPYINLGITAYKSGDFQSALQYLNKAYQMDPNRGEIAYNLGLLSYEQNEYSRAAGFYEGAAQKIPEDPKVWNNLGCAYFKQKEYKKAYEAFKNSIERGAAFYHAFYNMAVGSILSGNYENAVEDTRKAVQLAPENPEAYNLLGLAYIFNQSYLKASMALAHAIQKDPNNTGYLNNLGRAQLGLAHYREAEKAFQKALLFNPELKPAQWNMGDLKLRQGKFQEALTLYENVGDWNEARQSPVFQYNWGVAYYRSGDHEKSRQAWETARGMDPQYVEPYYGLAILFEEEKNFDKSFSMIRQGQVLEPQSSRWARLEGDLEMAQGKTKEALESYERAKTMGQTDASLMVRIEQLREKGGTAPVNGAETVVSPTFSAPESEPNDTEGYKTQIQHSLSMGNLDEALALAQQETDRWKTRPSSWEDLSSVFLKMNQNEKAFQAVKRAQELSPRNVHFLEETGHAAFLAGRYLIARDYFDQLTTVSPSFNSFLALGSCAYKLNQFEQAIQFWEKGLGQFPKRPEFYYNLSRAHYGLGQKAQAELYLQKALKLKPNFPEAITNSAAMDLDADRLLEAEKKLRQSLSMDPQIPETYFNLGNLELKRGNNPEAMKNYQRGLDLNLDDADAYYYQGVACLKQSQWSKAQVLLEKALEKNPNHAGALYNLGKIAIETNEEEMALKFFQESLKYSPNRGDAIFGIGLVYFHQRHYLKAKESFVKSQEDPKIQAEATYYLGQILEKQGDKAAAADLYRLAITMKPNLGFPHLALGNLLKEGGQMNQARLEFQKAVIQTEYPAVAKKAEEQLAELK